MAVDTVAEHTEPEPGPYDPILKAQDSAALERWLPHHTALVGETEGALRVHIYLQGLTGASKAEKAVQNAERHDAALAAALDPTSHPALGFAFDQTLVVLLVAFEVIWLYWAAQAVDLDSSGTWLVTFILVAASAGAMLRFELTRRDARRCCLLAAVAAAGYLALLAMRAGFLSGIVSESLLVAFLQAAMLIIVSVGLVLCASATLTRPGSPALSHSRIAGRHARPDAAQAHTEPQAAHALERHRGGLRHILLPWAFGPAAPAGIDRNGWAAALRMTIRRSFAAP